MKKTWLVVIGGVLVLAVVGLVGLLARRCEELYAVGLVGQATGQTRAARRQLAALLLP